MAGCDMLPFVYYELAQLLGIPLCFLSASPEFNFAVDERWLVETWGCLPLTPRADHVDF